MRAVVPLNVTALRVSSTDASNVTPGFAGRTAAFDQLPHQPSDAPRASTGDTVWRVLQSPPSDALGTGIHLHWELPEYFKRGHHDPGTNQIAFPHAPTRWLVIRSLRVYDSSQQTYGPLQNASWIVESDYVSPQLSRDGDGVLRPAVAVPLNGPDGTPFMYMGRVVKASDWNPAGEQPQNYLPAYNGPDGAPLYLTSIGFVGAAFSSYYPDCRSVFGFWDTFADVDAVHGAITQNTAIRFRVSYNVTGWLPDPADDPLTHFGAAVTSSYHDYVTQCAMQNVSVARTPTDIFQQLAADRFGWNFSSNAISFTLGNDHNIASVQAPESTVCAGVVQDIVWNAANPSTDTPFLAAPGDTSAWSDQVEIAIGNTTVEAASALVKSDLPAPDGSDELASYELLLDALQLGVLRDLESDGTSLVTLERALHAKAFNQVDGGHQWTIQAAATSGADTTTAELTLPLTLAEQLSVLNSAQRTYDSGRARLTVIRQQLFMDWLIFVKQWVARPNTPVVDTNALSAFLATSSGGELNAVVTASHAVGTANFAQDPSTGHIVGVSTTDGTTTLAGQLVTAFRTVATALQGLDAGWRLDAVPADPFWQPTDPVLLLEGDRLEPVRRNGPTSAIAVRADAELITTVTLTTDSTTLNVSATSLQLPAPPATMPAADTAAATIGEAALLDPQYAAAIAAVASAPDASALAAAIAACQGGQSPLEASSSSGLYATVHDPGHQPQANPAQTVQAPEQLTTTFTNTAQIALAPDPVAWSAQAALPEFSPTRADPFLPVWLTWTASLDPLARSNGANYGATTIKDSFALNADVTDLSYPTPASFTTGQPVTYQGSVVLSKKPAVSLTQQIDQYMLEFPQDAADPELTKARDDLAGRKLLAQSLGTFNLAQTLRTTIPQIQVVDLVRHPDFVTPAIAGAANAKPGDSWYDTAFNSLAPISTTVQAEYNFGPLRSGFLEIRQLSIIDVFGQRMNLNTATTTSTGALRVVPSIALSPATGDSANAEKAYLPPRALAPCRTDARWLSATHNDAVPGSTQDFVEVNAHPATSPVCGWIVPNHLDVSLAFYNADGTPIGSFGIEHGDSKYRTRAGNLANPSDDIATDIGPVDSPKPGVNPHVARLMWFIDGQPVSFLGALMATIARSNTFINPLNFAQDVALSTLIGQPLAIARTSQAISTAGGTLPVSQANTTAADALAQTVKNGWTDYGQRQTHTCAALDQVTFAARLGDLTNIDDGLVAFLPEAQGQSPYSTVFSAAAPAGAGPNVKQPDPDTVTLTLNGPALTLTVLVDPRAPVHVTTGVLPTVAMQIPPDQYLRAMQQLAVTFATRPVLHDQLGLRLPLPAEAGFAWTWVTAGQAPAALPTSTPADTPIYGHGPQRLLEGWLDLIPNPPSGEQ